MCMARCALRESQVPGTSTPDAKRVEGEVISVFGAHRAISSAGWRRQDPADSCSSFLEALLPAHMYTFANIDISKTEVISMRSSRLRIRRQQRWVRFYLTIAEP